MKQQGKIKESDIQSAILQYLNLKHIFHYRNNTGAFRTERGGFYKFGEVGSPDIICVVRGRFIGIECKTPTGKLNDNQLDFKERLEEAGGMYVVARSLDDISNIL
jgi:hypothetical protein